MLRPTPFELVFRQTAQTTFPSIRSALDLAGQDPRDRDGFLMVREVVTLLKDLRPDEGLGEGIEQLGALVHHAYLFWAAGSLTVAVSAARLEELLGDQSAAASKRAELPPYYVQLAERRVWAQVIPGHPPEPLDGCFVHRDSDPMDLRVLGVFGVYGDRPGFSVVEVTGPKPVALARDDGSPLFTSTLSGGVAARLFSLAGAEELLEVGWRVFDKLGAGSRELGGNLDSSPVLAPRS